MARGKREMKWANLPPEERRKAGKNYITLHLLQMAVVLITLTAAVATYVSNAWFANNKTVAAEDSTISSEAVASLFISPGAGAVTLRDNGVSYSVGFSDKGKLFPISTLDCKNWYYLDTVTQTTTVTDGVTKVTRSEGGFGAASISAANGVGSYSSTQVLKGTDGRTIKYLETNVTRTAYLYTEYRLYTAGGDMEVYLDPDNPIRVTKTDKAAKDLDDAVRVAVVVGTLDGSNNASFTNPPVLIYATSPEDDGFKGLGAESSTIQVRSSTLTKTDLTDYKAVQNGDNYTAGTNSLGTATAAGLPVRVYVWMEGTDADAVLGIANGRDNLRVAINYVGVAPTA